MSKPLVRDQIELQEPIVEQFAREREAHVGSASSARGAGFQPFVALGFTVLLTVSCATLLSSPTTEPPTREGPPRGRVAFVGTDGNIYTVGPDGKDRHAVTGDAAPSGSGDRVVFYESPTWAPVTSRLAFVRFEADAGGSASVQVQSASPSGAVRDLYTGREVPFYLYWGPSGESLSFLSSAPGEEGLGLWLVEGEDAARPLDRGQPYYWAWAPDGRALFTHVGGSADANPEGARLSRLMVEGADRVDLDLPPTRFQAPAFSPDGSRVLVAGEPDGSAPGLLVLDDRGSVLRRLASTPGGVAFDWSPLGDRVAFVLQEAGDPLGFGELNLVDLNRNGEAETRPTGLQSVAGFFWSPDGLRLAAFVPEFGSEGDDQLISFGRQERRLRLHLHLVDAATGDAVELTSFQPTEAFLSILPFYDQYQRSSTIWSPDGRALVYTGQNPSGRNTVYAMRAEPGAEAQRLGRGALAFWSWE